MKHISILALGLLISITSLAQTSAPVVAEVPAPNAGSTPPAVPPTNEPIARPDALTVAPPAKTVEILPEKPEAKPEAAPTAASAPDSGHSRGRVGLHAALGLPHPMTFGMDYLTAGKMFSFSVIGGGFSREIEEVTVGIRNLEFQFRYHPFSGSFYAGAGLGSHQITAKKKETITAIEVEAEVTVKASYVTPQIGWLWVWDSGLQMGFHFGYLSPRSVTTDLKTNADSTIQATTEYKKLEKDVKEQGNDIGDTALPVVSLLHIGWMF